MRLKIKIGVLFTVMWTLQVNGQQIVKNLNIGDSLPIFRIPKIIRSNVETTEYYRDKLLIIDFWSTGCGGCVAALPKVEALQKQFGDKIAILPVTFEKKNYIVKFLKNNAYTKSLKIPTVVEDQIFQKYFKHQYVSHEVWVYKGKVIGITDLEYVDEYNIRKVLNGEQTNWPLKYDFYTFDNKKPLFALNDWKINEGEPKHFQYAAIGDAKDKYSSSLLPGRCEIIRDPIKKRIRIYCLNQSIYSSYVLNWMNVIRIEKLIKPAPSIQANQIVWEVKDRSKYFYEKSYGYRGDWMRKNAICFESVYPDTGQNDKQVYRSVIADMDRLLGLKVRWEKRKEKVMVVTRIISFNRKHKKTVGQKYNIGQIVYNLNQEQTNPYVFDESNASGTEILIIKTFWRDLSKIRLALQEYGFDLKAEEREVDKLIFTENR